MENVVADVHAELDIGNLLISNITELIPTNKRDQNEKWLKSLAQKGTQLLINKIFELPFEYQEHISVVKLPAPSTVVPRAKPVPKAKPPSKWEEYAKQKGIIKRKRENLVWDEASKDWKPRWGYRSIKNEKSDWLVEIPPNADPNIDYFAKKKETKVQSVAKNEYQRLRNIAVSNKVKVRNMELADTANKEQISRSISSTKAATASAGKFVDKLSKEKPPKNMGNRRKFESNFTNNIQNEKDKNLQILEEINRKKPKLDIKEAVEKYVNKTGRKTAGRKFEKNESMGKNNKAMGKNKTKPRNNKTKTPIKKKHVKGQHSFGKAGKKRR